MRSQDWNIGWENHSWKYLSLIVDERIINLQRTKVYVFSDSVLCLGKIFGNPESNDAWEQRLGWIKSSPNCRNFDRIDGEPMEFEWNISQDSIRCSSVKKSKVYCTDWEKHQKFSQEESYSCRCSTTFPLEQKTMKKRMSGECQMFSLCPKEIDWKLPTANHEQFMESFSTMSNLSKASLQQATKITETLTESMVSQSNSSGLFFPGFNTLQLSEGSQKFTVQIGRNTSKFHRKNHIHVDVQLHFLWNKRQWRRECLANAKLVFSVSKEIDWKLPTAMTMSNLWKSFSTMSNLSKASLQQATKITETLTESMVSQSNSSGLFSKDSIRCSSVKKSKV